jgi:hypothetical protein
VALGWFYRTQINSSLAAPASSGCFLHTWSSTVSKCSSFWESESWLLAPAIRLIHFQLQKVWRGCERESRSAEWGREGECEKKIKCFNSPAIDRDGKKKSCGQEGDLYAPGSTTVREPLTETNGQIAPWPRNLCTVRPANGGVYLNLSVLLAIWPESRTQI